MKRLIFSTAVILFVSTLSAQKTVINDPNAEVRSAKDFHAIEVSHAINLYLTQGDEEAVAVSAKDIKYRDHIRTEVKNGVLKIWYENDHWNWNSGNKGLKAYVSFKNISKLTASGASDVAV